MEDWKKQIDNYSKKHFNQSNDFLQRDEKQFINNFKEYWGENYLNDILSLNSLKDTEKYNKFIDAIKLFLADEREYTDNKNRVRKKGPRYKKITTSQIRNVLTKIKPIKDISEIMRIRTELAYTAGRATTKEIKEIMFLFEQLVKNIKTNEQLNSFKDFVEAIISYHRYLGGK